MEEAGAGNEAELNVRTEAESGGGMDGRTEEVVEGGEWEGKDVKGRRLKCRLNGEKLKRGR